MFIRLHDTTVLSYTERALPPGRYPRGLSISPDACTELVAHLYLDVPAVRAGAYVNFRLKDVAQRNTQPRSRLHIHMTKHPGSPLGASSCLETPGALLIGVCVRTRGLHCTAAGIEQKHRSDPLGSPSLRGPTPVLHRRY